MHRRRGLSTMTGNGKHPHSPVPGCTATRDPASPRASAGMGGACLPVISRQFRELQGIIYRMRKEDSL